MSEEPPFFEEAIRQVEERLGNLFGAQCNISVHVFLDDRLADEVHRIDSNMFRDELTYSIDELRKKGEKRGFVLMVVRSGMEPVAFFFGYEDPDFEGSYYGDTLASVVEGKGIGSSLFSLVHIYCYENGYTHFSCHTEEMDEKGRRLRDWYLGAGMEYLGTHPKEGDLMRVKLTLQHASWMHKRFIMGEKQLQKPAVG